MMKLIADSSANLTMLEGVTYQSVPMTIRAGERDFVDDETLDTHELLDYLAAHNGKSGTACPSLDGWLKAFEGADFRHYHHKQPVRHLCLSHGRARRVSPVASRGQNSHL